MARNGYPVEFRQRVVDLVESGRRVAEVAAELGIIRAVDLNMAPTGSHRCWCRTGIELSGARRADGSSQTNPGVGNRAGDSSPSHGVTQR